MEAGAPLGPEDPVRVEALHSRRWAYAAFLLALLAAVGAAVALVFLFSAADQGRATNATLLRLEQDVGQLKEQARTARAAESKASTAAGRSRSLDQRVDALEAREAASSKREGALRSDLTTSTTSLRNDVNSLRSDVQKLRTQVDQLRNNK
jgi:hypothetical protein